LTLDAVDAVLKAGVDLEEEGGEGEEGEEERFALLLLSSDDGDKGT